MLFAAPSITIKYLPAYGYLEINEMCQFHSSISWRVLYTTKCAGISTIFYNPYLKIYFKSSKIFKSSIINQMIFRFILPQVPVL